MAIVKLEDKFKSNYKLLLTPERQFISSSSGITGSIYVFPNRSETQKDNIDERLNLAPLALEGSEFSGEPIRPYDSNSLEQRRIEIYKGEFNKIIGGAFVDALQYSYRYADTNDNSNDGVYTGQALNLRLSIGNGNTENGIAGFNASIGNPPVTSATLINVDGTDGKVFEYTSNGNWVAGIDVFNRLPTSDRDRSAQRYDIALGLLLDGANPFTQDHAWRGYVPHFNALGATKQINGVNYNYELGNTSYTGITNAGIKSVWQFSGLTVAYDDADIPYNDTPLSKKSDVNAWPPEALQTDIPIITNWLVKGYSDLSMHPRNKTQKNIKLLRAGNDAMSKANSAGKILYNKLSSLSPEDQGWFVENKHALSLSSYIDEVGVERVPALAYRNSSDRYTVKWHQNDTVIFDFCVKPCKEQTSVGTILQLTNNYAIVLIPATNSLRDGVYHNYKIGFYAQNAAVDGGTVNLSDVTSNGNSFTGKYITPALLELNKWSNIVIRWSQKFNNGLLGVYIDGKLISSATEDGVYATGRTGLINTKSSPTSSEYNPGNTLMVGGWQPSGSSDALWRVYARRQELEDTTITNASYAAGLSVKPKYQLLSELAELRVWNKTQTEKEILQNMNNSLTSADGLRFYMSLSFDPRDDTPQWNRPAYIPSTRNASTKSKWKRSFAYANINKSTLSYNKVPFCTNSAYVAGMPFINVHSHLRDYAQGSYPVITGMPTLINPSTTSTYPITNNKRWSTYKLEYIESSWQQFDWLKNINSMILPSDNLEFKYRPELHGGNHHRVLDNFTIRLDGSEIGSTTSQYEISHFLDDEVFAIQDTINNLDPVVAGEFTGATDPSRNTEALIAKGLLYDHDFLTPLSIIIDIPTIYYGSQINPESIVISSQINAAGKIIEIIDKEGTLYRKTPAGKIGTKVGHVDYYNGVVCIFSHLLTNIGLYNGFEIKFKGQKNLHVLQVDVPCSSGVANISQNPNFQTLKASANANETDSNVTYISNIYLHDENLNIIGKVNLAQPIQKREEDSFLFRIKMDF